MEINVEATTIKPQTTARYLGVIFDNKLNWGSHIKDIESRLASRINLLRFLSRYCADAEPNIKILLNLFKSLVRTIITYGSYILLTANDNVWERLQITQNKALRAALGMPFYTSVDYIHQLRNMPKIEIYATVLLKQAISTVKNYKDKISEENLMHIFSLI
ncbi:unnamed protein product [Rotaria magnacalcarata]|uniref:Uncharacterized protein n=1 Tax=Rotaria magnacalcarata TaxID=392030 RepID=A0A816TRE2_9BILA|nr:unnamed protein product [Rotaria magnacalcarata]CAF2104412.1 unnamed protein product [Rotaria magnacalcarata]